MSDLHQIEKKRLAVNVVSSGVSNIFRFSIQIVLLPVLARMIGPEEFGVYAIAVPIISFFSVIADGGLGSSLSRVEETDDLVWSTASWLAIAMGIFIAALVVIMGAVVAFFTGNAKAGNIIATLSSTFFILSFGIVPNALLVRQGRLTVHNIADVSATVLGAVAAIGCAYNACGAWSFVAQSLMSVVVRSVVLNAYAFRLPRFVFDVNAVKPHLISGSAMIGSKLSEFFGRVVENLIISTVLGDTALGSFSFANQSSRYIVDLFGNTLWGSVYSFSLRSEKQKAISSYLKLIRLLAIVLLPIAFFAAAAAPTLFNIFLGERWQASSHLFSIIICLYTVYAISSQVGALSYAFGANYVLFGSSAVYAVARLIGTCVGIKYGIDAVAWGTGLSSFVYGLYMISAQHKLIPGSFIPTLKSLFVPAAAAASGAIAISAALQIHWNTYGTLPFAIIAGISLYAIAIIVFDKGQTAREIGMIAKMFSRR